MAHAAPLAFLRACTGAAGRATRIKADVGRPAMPLTLGTKSPKCVSVTFALALATIGDGDYASGIYVEFILRSLLLKV